jgi:cell division septum initiation protein DivIVA
MKRLEYARRIRSAPGRARNTAEAMMFLAAVARERHRLEQERQSLERRITRIDARLAVLASTETKLVPAIQNGSTPAHLTALAPLTRTAATTPPHQATVRAALPVGVTQVTLHY